ncbi:glycosyl hydrolase family 65 protein [Mycobacterium tilburgii]|uniref:glycosyl hydrolase family 65 protein n=1 Tax=Mycobacterium tilburgii TaxID=44467 RepID=UPI0038996837
MQWQSNAFTPEQKARNVDYYERRTVRDLLAVCCQAVMCAKVGHLELAHDYAYEAALIDLRDLYSNTRDGPAHGIAGRGAWMAIVAGFDGLRDDDGILEINPALPDGISRLQFRVRWRDFRLTVDANHADVTYTLTEGTAGELSIRHAGEEILLKTDEPTTFAVRPRKALLPPPQADTARRGPLITAPLPHCIHLTTLGA